MSKKIKAILSFALCLALMLTALLPSVSVNPVSAAEYSYTTWDFNDLEIGSGLPSPWTTEGGGTITVTQDPDDSTNKYLYINDTTNTRASANISFIPMYEEFTVEVKLKLDLPAGSAGTSFAVSTSLTNATTKPEISVGWNDNGSVFAFDGTAQTTILTDGLGKWINFKAVINPVAKTYDLYMDGECVADDFKYRFDNGSSYLNFFHVSPWATRSGEYYIDDVVLPKEKELLSVDKYIPEYNEVEILYDANIETAETDEYYDRTYLAFPTIQKINDEKVIIIYKRGIGHFGAAAHNEIMVYNPTAEEIISRDILYNVDGENPQNPEFAIMPNGDYVVFLDRQNPSLPLVSLGVRKLRSTDGGVTWALDPGNTEDEFTNNDEYALLQDTDGVQYFTNYEDVVIGDTIYMIASTDHSSASDLAGYGTYGNGVTTVHIIKSTDNGYTWEHVKNITEECGMSINESSFEPLDNGGFFFVCRGEDERTTVFTTDADFNITKKSIISDEYSCIQYIGRPSIFRKDGEYYLICRNIPQNANEELALYRFDVENLVPETYVVIEEAMTSARCGMGHYAEPFFVEKDGVEYLNIINYTDAYTFLPDIVRYELKWDEIKDPVIKTPDETETVTVAVPVAEAESWNNAVAPIYDTELSNLSVSFEYTANNDAVWYFDVVDDDYSNCYSLNLTESGMTLNRTVAGETTALASYDGFENGKYYEIQLVRYMEDITVFVDGVKAMAIAEEDAAYPVTTTGTDTHWRGKLYLDDAKTSVTNIKVYDSGLITFENGKAYLSNLELSDDISLMLKYGDTSSVTLKENAMSVGASGITNAAAYTSGWLNEDVGDFVLTYNDRFSRENWTHRGLIFSAEAAEEPGNSQFFFATDNTFGIGAAINRGD